MNWPTVIDELAIIGCFEVAQRRHPLMSAATWYNAVVVHRVAKRQPLVVTMGTIITVVVRARRLLLHAKIDCLRTRNR